MGVLGQALHELVHKVAVVHRKPSMDRIERIRHAESVHLRHTGRQFAGMRASAWHAWLDTTLPQCTVRTLTAREIHTCCVPDGEQRLQVHTSATFLSNNAPDPCR